MDQFVAVALPAGFFRNGTPYQGKGRWINGSLVRWVDGALRPIGGWTAALTAAGATIQVVGFPRAAIAWRKNDSTAWVGVGTNTKLEVYSQGVLTDITPAGLVTGVADGSASSGFGAYGAGNYGAGVYGGAGAAGTISDADSWTLDNFGEILLACLTSDGKIYESTPTAQATQVTNSPTGNRAVVVTPERFVFALGAGSDPRLVQWSDQSNRTSWAVAAGSKAGSFPLQTGGRLMAGKRSDRETLLWTDADLWAAVFIGGTLVYSFQRRGTDCGLIGPNAVCMAGTVAYWMSNKQFLAYAYPGPVRSIPCEVSDYVFGDLSLAQRAKITAVSLSQFKEVWWFYPSASQTGTENDRYVKLNTDTGKFDTGNLGRAAAVGTDVFPNPQMWASDGTLYTHENGQNRSGQTAFVESGPLLDGDRVIRIQSLIPDTLQGPLQATFFGKDHQQSAESTFGPYALSPITDVRLTTRQPRIKLDDLGAAVDWRLGTFQLGVQQGGYR
jgi:hypothetical protein